MSVQACVCACVCVGVGQRINLVVSPQMLFTPFFKTWPLLGLELTSLGWRVPGILGFCPPSLSSAVITSACLCGATPSCWVIFFLF